jgi:hypothetical protein
MVVIHRSPRNHLCSEESWIFFKISKKQKFSKKPKKIDRPIGRGLKLSDREVLWDPRTGQCVLGLSVPHRWEHVPEVSG